MPIGIGLDDQACTDVADPWQNMRIGIYAVRSATGDPTSMLPEDALRMATLGSAEVLGVADRVGSLEVGKLADFVVVDPLRPDIGPLWHPVRSYVLACSLRNLRAVYIGGAIAGAALSSSLNLFLKWFFVGFNWVFGLATQGYVGLVSLFLTLSVFVLAGYGVLLWLTYAVFTSTPTGFIPQQDTG